MTDTRTFLDDDAAYLAWRDAHPSGFIINHDRSPSRAYIKLHRTLCQSLCGDPPTGPGSSWTTAYGKTCAESIADLTEWAKQRTGADPDPCGLCEPL